MIPFHLALLLLALQGIEATSYKSRKPSVTVTGTKFIGLTNADTGIDSFLGIPFAQPPVNERRLREPEAFEYSGVSKFTADSWSPACTQPGLPIENDFTTRRIAEVTEDCLTLNIFRPEGTKPSSKLSVLVWIYGGSFMSGAAYRYDPSSLIQASQSMKEPIIFVSLNYRLGLLGFANGVEAQNARATNLGLLDQQMAVEWVYKNIARFGGDRSKITMAGQSAGSVSVAWHLLARRLPIRGAILESGTANTLSAVVPAERQSVFDAASQAAGCTDAFDQVACLRALPLDELLSATKLSRLTPFSYVPTIDGRFLSQAPDVIMRKGSFKRVPIMIGSSVDEGTAFVPRSELYADRTDLSIQRYLKKLVYTSTESIIDKLIKTYPNDQSVLSPHGTGEELFDQPVGYKKMATILGDVMFHSPQRLLLKQTTERGVPAFGYIFDGHRDMRPSARGVTHGAELAYLFPDADQIRDQGVLVNRVHTYWINFVNHQNPNTCIKCEKPRYWPKYDNEKYSLLNLTSASRMPLIRDSYRKKSLALISNHPFLK